LEASLALNAEARRRGRRGREEEHEGGGEQLWHLHEGLSPMPNWELALGVLLAVMISRREKTTKKQTSQQNA